MEEYPDTRTHNVRTASHPLLYLKAMHIVKATAISQQSSIIQSAGQHVFMLAVRLIVSRARGKSLSTDAEYFTVLRAAILFAMAPFDWFVCLVVEVT